MERLFFLMKCSTFRRNRVSCIDGDGGVGGEKIMKFFDVSYPQPPNLVGRETLLNDLHQHVSNTRGAEGGAVLCGPAGVGKTRIAVEYAYRYAEQYPGGVYYINARRNWSYELARVAESRAMKPTRPATAPLERDRWLSIAFQRYLADILKEPILMIFDNVVDPREIKEREIGQGLHVSDLKAHIIAIGERIEIPEPLVAFPVHPLGASYISEIIGHDNETFQEMVGGFPQSAFLLRTALDLAPNLQTASLRHYMESRDPVTALLSWHRDRLDDDPLLIWKLLATFRRESVIPLARLELMTGFDPVQLRTALQYLVKAGLVEQLADDNVELHARIRRFVRGHIQTYRDPLPSAARRFVHALHNPAIMQEQAQARGVRALLIDVEEVGIACLEDDSIGDELTQLQRLLEWEVPYLREWNRKDIRPIQQIRERAHHQQHHVVRDQFDTWLAHHAHFRTEMPWYFPLKPIAGADLLWARGRNHISGASRRATHHHS